MERILILGAGATGTIISNKLSRDLRDLIAKDEVEITVLDKNDVNINQAGFTFIPFGLYNPKDIQRPRRILISPRVKTIFGEDGEINHVDLQNREVKVKSGKNYTYDYLVIATGCKADIVSISGLSKEIDTFYTSLEDALKLRETMDLFTKGRIVILTVKMPIPCPGAPSKFMMLLEDYIRHTKKIRDNVNMTFLWPISAVGPPVYNAGITKAFKDRGVDDRREFKFSSIEAEKREVVSSDGERIKYDLLITIPPYKGIQELQNSGITDENGWVPANKYTLQYSSHLGSYDEVYVAGDAGPAEILKTGISAHYQAFTIAQNLINEIERTGVEVHYMGDTGCPFVDSTFSPSTRGKAFMLSWAYETKPEPFRTTEAGWLFYRMYYYIYWDSTIKALL